MPFCPLPINQDTQAFSETSQQIVLQNCQHPFSSLIKQPCPENDHQFDTICEDSHIANPDNHFSQSKEEPGFSNKFRTPEKQSHWSTPLPTQLTPTSPHPSPKSKPQKLIRYFSKKRQIQQKSQQFQRNLRHQQKLFALCFQYMNEQVANKIAQESGIATEAFIKRKRQAERNNKMIEQFMEMMDCESTSSWSSLSGRKRRNWFRRVSRKDVRTVMDYLRGLDKQVDIVKIREKQDDEVRSIDSDKGIQIKGNPEDHQDMIEYLKVHSLFIENLPPRISYSELQKYLQRYGQISHFLILDYFSRRKPNDPVSLEARSSPFRSNKLQEQSKIIGFVEFTSVGPVQVMLSLMNEKKLRYFVQNIDAPKEQFQEKEPEQSIRKTSQESDLMTVQEEQEQKKCHGSRKIYVRQVDWYEMLKTQNKTNQSSSINNKQIQLNVQNPQPQPTCNNDQPSPKNNRSSVVQNTNQTQMTQRPALIYEGWQYNKEQSNEESQRKKINLQKLNILRLKLKLVKSTPTVKEQPSQTIESQKKYPELGSKCDKEALQDNQQQKNIEDEVYDNSSKPNYITEELTLNNLKQLQERLNEQIPLQNTVDANKRPSKQSQTQPAKITQDCTQTECPNMFSEHIKQKNSAISQITMRCEQCVSREKRAIKRSIEKQIHITVGVKSSCEIPYKSALSTFYQEQRISHTQQRQFVKNGCHSNLNINHGQNFEINRDILPVNIIEQSVVNKCHTEGVIAQDQIPIHQQDRRTEIVEQCRQITQQAVQSIQTEKNINFPHQKPTQSHETTHSCPQRLLLTSDVVNSKPFETNPQSIQAQSYNLPNQHQEKTSSSDQPSSSSSSIYSSSSPIPQPQTIAPTKPKSFFQFSLWESDQDNLDLHKNPSLQSFNQTSIDKNLKLSQRLQQNGLSNSPILTLERHKHEEIHHKEEIYHKRDKLCDKFQQDKQKSGPKSQFSAQQSRSSRLKQIESSSSVEKGKYFQSRTNQSYSNNVEKHYEPRYRQKDYKHSQSHKQRSLRYDRDRSNKRQDQTSFRYYEREKSWSKFQREDTQRGRNQSRFRQEKRHYKFNEKDSQKNSRYKLSGERHIDHYKEYGNYHTRNDQRQSSRRSSRYEEKNQKRNYQSNRIEKQRKPKFSTSRNNKEEDHKAKRSHQKQATKNGNQKQVTQRKWKYSEYVQEEKSSSKGKQRGNKGEDWSY